MCPFYCAGWLITVADLTFAKSLWIHNLFVLERQQQTWHFPLNPLKLQLHYYLSLQEASLHFVYPWDKRKHCSGSWNVSESRHMVSQHQGRCNSSKAAALYGKAYNMGVFAFMWVDWKWDASFWHCRERKKAHDRFLFVLHLHLCFPLPPLWKKKCTDIFI